MSQFCSSLGRYVLSSDILLWAASCSLWSTISFCAWVIGVSFIGLSPSAGLGAGCSRSSMIPSISPYLGYGSNRYRDYPLHRGERRSRLGIVGEWPCFLVKLFEHLQVLLLCFFAVLQNDDQIDVCIPRFVLSTSGSQLKKLIARDRSGVSGFLPSSFCSWRSFSSSSFADALKSFRESDLYFCPCWVSVLG